MSTPMLKTAIHYAALGFAVHWLTPRQKGPRDRGWSIAPVADAATLRTRFTPRSNVGVRCGHWSRPQAGHGLVILDLDIQTADVQHDALKALDSLLDTGTAVPTVISGRGNGSRHLWFACPLDRLPDKASCTILKAAHWQLEVLSTGKQVVCPPSIHPTGTTYQWTQPLACPLPVLPEPIHAAIRAALQEEHTTSRTRGRTVHGPTDAAPGTRPGDHYNHALSWGDILEPAGWQVSRTHDDVTYWCRPGKTHGISAATGGGGYDLLYVFSSNAEPLRERTSYSKFGAYTVLHHGGDFAAAARTLGQRGYGQQRTPRNDQHAPEPPPPGEETRPPPKIRHAHVVHMEQVEAQPVQWLWWPYIARGTVTMLDGDPGIGKSLLTLYLGAIVSNGHPLPDQQGKPTLATGMPGGVVLLSAEDSVTHTIKQRLTDARANQHQIKVVTSYIDEHGDEQFLTLDADNRPLLEQVLQDYHPTLVIIDPLQAFLGKMDMHRANETRPFMRGLQHLAETYNVSLICVRHPAKPGQQLGKALHRGLGSVDFIGAARSGLFVEQHPVDRDKVLVCHFKNNLERLGRTQIFSKQEGRFAWAGVSRFTADVIAGGGPGPQPQALMEAMYWLETTLENGLPQPAEILMNAMKDEGHKRDTIHRAKQALGIRSSKVADTWLWTLPPLPEILPPDIITGSSGSSDTTRSTGSSGSSTKTNASTTQSEDPEPTLDRQDPEDPVDVLEGIPPGRMSWTRPAAVPQRPGTTE